MNKQALRKELQAAFPSAAFRIRTISFSDLARGSATFVLSDSWGAGVAMSEGLFLAVREIARKHGAIANW